MSATKSNTGFFCLFFLVTFSGNSIAQDINVADSIIQVLQSSPEDLSDSAKYELYSQIAENHPNPEMKISYAKKALEIAEIHNNDLWKAYSYNFIGYGYKWKGDLHRAINSFYDAVKYFVVAENDMGLAAVYSAIGDTYSASDDHENSVIFYRKAIKIFREKKVDDNLATVMLNLGDEFIIKNEIDSALKYSFAALALNRQVKNNSGIGYCLGNIGLIYSKQHNPDSAVFFIHQALEILKKLGDGYSVSTFSNSLAEIYLSQGDPDLALEHAFESLKIAKKEGLKEQMRDASLVLSNIYRKKNDYEKAYLYQNQYIALRDSINNEAVIRKIADLRTEYEVSQKQAEVDLLEQRSKMQRTVNYGLAIVVLLLIVLAYIIYQNSLKRKKINQLLSEQKQEIAAQRDQLKELVQMKDRFFGIISHDLRSPVNSLQGIVQLLNHYVKLHQIDQIEEFVKLTDKSINNLSSLLDNLLSWALSQQGSLPYNPEKFKFFYVAEEVKRIFSNTAISKNIAFEVTVPKELEVCADRDSIFAMTRNLVNNAIKFTPEGGKVFLEAEKEGDFAKITVSDTGVGIPADKLRNIFDFHKQKSTKGTAGEKGSGLGLALCHDIVKLNNGTIEIDSREGAGTTIVAYVPLEKN